jgi:hypothetical protein
MRLKGGYEGKVIMMMKLIWISFKIRMNRNGSGTLLEQTTLYLKCGTS